MPDWDPEANDLFLRAVERGRPEDRRRFLDGACAGRPDLRDRVDGLIRAGEQAGSFLEHPALDSGPTSAHGPGRPERRRPAPGAGTVVGPYKLVQEIGEGGMGTVYLAAADRAGPAAGGGQGHQAGHGQPAGAGAVRGRAAGAGPDGPPEHRQGARRRGDARGPAVLRDGAGQGGADHQVLRRPPARRAGPARSCSSPVCQAVQHAHQKGIIHRDLKPNNVLVAPYDGRPVVKVIDFGVAKATGQPLTERTLLTGFGAVVGTPEYMSPEQAELNNLDIDTRSDIYSLGVLLYELLTGTTPLTAKRLKEAALLEMLRVIREEEPPKPSTRLSTTEELPSIAANRGLEPARLCGLVRGELDWIVMKALEKDRNRRYETANGFAQDVERYLADEPVQACPPSAWYRLRKFARRNRTALAVAGLVLFFIALLGGVGGWVVRDRAARQARVAHDLDGPGPGGALSGEGNGPRPWRHSTGRSSSPARPAPTRPVTSGSRP